jgi:hypothetical protein
MENQCRMKRGQTAAISDVPATPVWHRFRGPSEAAGAKMPCPRLLSYGGTQSTSPMSPITHFPRKHSPCRPRGHSTLLAKLQMPENTFPTCRFELTGIADVNTTVQHRGLISDDRRQQRRATPTERFLIFFRSTGEIDCPQTMSIAVDVQCRNERHFNVSKRCDRQAD